MARRTARMVYMHTTTTPKSSTIFYASRYLSSSLPPFFSSLPLSPSFDTFTHSLTLVMRSQMQISLRPAVASEEIRLKQRGSVSTVACRSQESLMQPVSMREYQKKFNELRLLISTPITTQQDEWLLIHRQNVNQSGPIKVRLTTNLGSSK